LPGFEGKVGGMEIPVALSISYQGEGSIPFQEGLSTSFRNVIVIKSMHSDSFLFENGDCSVTIGEECSHTLTIPTMSFSIKYSDCKSKGQNRIPSSLINKKDSRKYH
jgi:hypothetical protein